MDVRSRGCSPDAALDLRFAVRRGGGATNAHNGGGQREREGSGAGPGSGSGSGSGVGVLDFRSPCSLT